MTATQAIQESIRRWTLARAFAYEEQHAPPEERFQVGYTDGWRDIILGFGKTWEEAFRLADQTPIDISQEFWWGPHPDGVQTTTRRLVQRWRGLYVQFDPAGEGEMLGLITSTNFFFVPQVK
jgi:hypothetical protein